MASNLNGDDALLDVAQAAAFLGRLSRTQSRRATTVMTLASVEREEVASHV